MRPEPTQYASADGCLRKNWSGCMWKKDNQPASATPGSGGLDTDDTAVIEVVEPNSFVAVGDRLLVHLDSSCSTACPGHLDNHKQFKCSGGRARTSGETHNFLEEGS